MIPRARRASEGAFARFLCQPGRRLLAMLALFSERG
jgi:hypothetical protein